MAPSGAVPIVRTKLHRPPLSAGLVLRPRLHRRMDGDEEGALTLVTAPAGYGKSTLVSQWVESTDVPAVWLSLDDADSDPLLFATYLVTAIEERFEGALEGARAIIGGPNDLDVTRLSIALFNELERLTSPLVIVLDDYHRLDDNSEVHDLLRLYADHPPAGVRLVVISRRDPPLPLAKLRADHHVQEVRRADLRFDGGETDAFFISNASLALSPAALDNVKSTLEGWAAGMRLVALTLPRAQDPDAYLRALRGNITESRDYLLEQVVSDLSPEVRGGLVRASIVERFCPALLRALLACAPSEAMDSPAVGALIDGLLTSDMFAIRLDSEGRWFRHHHLFRAFLETELQQSVPREDVLRLYRAATDWYEGEGLIEDAIRYALLAEEPGRAADILMRARHAELDEDRGKGAERWLDLLPADFVATRHDLLIARAVSLVERHELQAARACTEAADALLEGAEASSTVAGELELLRGYCLLMIEGDAQSALPFLTAARDKIPRGHGCLRAEAALDLALAQQMLGDHARAIAGLDAVLLDVPAPSVMVESRTVAAKAIVQLLSGDLAGAARVSQQTAEIEGVAPYTARWAEYLHGLAALQQHRLSEAAEFLGAAATMPDVLHTRAATDAFAGLALTATLLGKSEEADAALDELRRFAARTGSLENRIVAESATARRQLLIGDVEAAFGWARALDAESAGYVSLFWLESPLLTAARALIAEGSDASAERAMALLEACVPLVEQMHNRFQWVETSTLLALALSRMGRVEEAGAQLVALLQEAAPRGWVRPFAEAGPQMQQMLRALELDGELATDRVHLLTTLEKLSAGATHPSSAPPRIPSSSPAGPDELTNREIDVLQLAAKRLQNKEIAQQLSISHQTVSSHLKSIYKKLGVQNRRQAAGRAAELGLLAQ